MEIVNINTELNKTPHTNARMKLRLVNLTGDESLTVFATDIENGQFIPAHYHKGSVEIYQVVFGEGVILIGKSLNGVAKWEDSYIVKQGDFLTIKPNIVHKIKNISRNTLRIISCSPLSHSSRDWYFVKDISHQDYTS